MKKDFIWAAVFSQTGSEILEVSNRLKRLPDIIVTNKALEKIETINPELLEKAYDRFVFVPKIPTNNEYVTALRHANLVTLHGYLRIVPGSVCYRYQMFNGHPGLITKYPELKGKDPQKRVWESNKPYNLHGHVIHKVSATVDEGEIVQSANFYEENIHLKYKNLDEYINALHTLAVKNWVAFLEKKLNNKL